VRGAENIRLQRPLLVASNRPGAFDSVAILSCIPRKDVKVFISDVSFTRAFSFARPIRGKDLADDEVMPAVKKIARRLLEDHLASLSTTLRSHRSGKATSYQKDVGMKTA